MFGILIYWFYHRVNWGWKNSKKSNDDAGYLSFYCDWDWVPRRNSVKKSHNQTSQVSSLAKLFYWLLIIIV